MNLLKSKYLWLLMSLFAAGLVIGSFVLTTWLNLHPCHLCIFQRLLFMLLTLFALLAFFAPGVSRRVAVFASLLVSAPGAGVAAYQSWLQAQPPGSISCVAGEPGLIERWVEWLGERVPELFLATGFCEEAELSILGLTLANWALLSFAAFFFVALWALFNKSSIQP